MKVLKSSKIGPHFTQKSSFSHWKVFDLKSSKQDSIYESTVHGITLYCKLATTSWNPCMSSFGGFLAECLPCLLHAGYLCWFICKICVKYLCCYICEICVKILCDICAVIFVNNVWNICVIFVLVLDICVIFIQMHLSKMHSSNLPPVHVAAYNIWRNILRVLPH